MEVISDYIKIVTTLLGIAYPILFQVVARLDEKYSSNLIVELFDKEKSKKLFKFFLISSLILIFLWSLKLRPILYLEGLNYYISNSASIFIIVSTALLVIVFFFFVNKILVYYTPSKFINYLIKNHRRSDINLIHFNALADVFLQSIQKKNASNTATISRFFYDAFKNERENSKNKPVLYPISYYQLVYNSIEELALLKNQSDQSLEYRTVGGIWLLGEGQDSEIHENTYIWLWRNISLAIKYENDDMVLHHWENASQFFSYNLSPVRIEHEKDTFEIKNKIEIAKRESERNTFIEFHYALGGLLLYKKRYSCIDRIFNFTRSQPPKYELLPETMQEVFNRYNQFRDPYSINFPWISSKFPFPDLNGIVSDDIIKKWICSYFALLFLRQYTIVPYLYGMEPLAYPSIPNSQGEKKKWIEGLEFFKAIISDFLSNTDLIMTLNYTFLSQEWCKANDKTYPIFYIDAFKEKLEKSYAHAEVNSSISDEKRKIFYTSSSSIIENTLTPYFDIHNSTLITEKLPRRRVEAWAIGAGRQ